MTDAPSPSLPFVRAQWRLARIWFSGAAVIYCVLMVQSLGSVYRGQLQQVWSAAMAMLLPTLSLIVTTFKYDAATTRTAKPKRDDISLVSQNFLQMTETLSICYLVLVFVTVLTQPLLVYFSGNRYIPAVSIIQFDARAPAVDVGSKPIAPADVLNVANLWLAPLQTLALGAMSRLFFMAKSE